MANSKWRMKVTEKEVDVLVRWCFGPGQDTGPFEPPFWVDEFNDGRLDLVDRRGIWVLTLGPVWMKRMLERELETTN